MYQAQRTVIGIFAHVDAGKTTLSESILYVSGAGRRQGSVDKRTSVLDSDETERLRGITIYGSQASFSVGKHNFTLIDTPGHVDFSTEAERSMSVLDYAILVISASEGIKPHTETLWRLLHRYSVPVFLFVNKCDLPNAGRKAITEQLWRKLSSGCIDLYGENFCEEAALTDEQLMEEYLATGSVSDEKIAELCLKRRFFPVIFGSALKNEGTQKLLDTLSRFCILKEVSEMFGARVWKIVHDDKGMRLTLAKITEGTLSVRDMVTYQTTDGTEKNEKITAIRVYQGNHFESLSSVFAGDICALTGLSETVAGRGLGLEKDSLNPVLEPCMSYTLELPEEKDYISAAEKIRILAEEDPALCPEWNAGKLHFKLMGRIQTETLEDIIDRRFGIKAKFGKGSVLYRETISEPVEGIGHFEPLRHYAEVHVVLRPLETGTGLRITTHANTDSLALNWQRLIVEMLSQKTHIGVLTGAPLTDCEICLVSGKAHPKHTDGGDFREAACRAVRQGLMKAKSILLEPIMTFRAVIPVRQLGRLINDLKARSALCDTPETIDEEMVCVKGTVPVSEISEYDDIVRGYSGGTGSFSGTVTHFSPCHNMQDIISEKAYDPIHDVENTPDSVFCSHGAGVIVKWDHVGAMAHLPAAYKDRFIPKRAERPHRIKIQSDELEKIMEREFGPISRPKYSSPSQEGLPKGIQNGVYIDSGRRIILYDGYNIIYELEELADLAQTDLELARIKLLDKVCNYSCLTGTEGIVVFDGYLVKDGNGEKTTVHGVKVVFTAEGETGDMYIEKFLHDIGPHDNVRVVTSDGLIQLAAVRFGILRMSSAEFEKDLEKVREKYL